MLIYPLFHYLYTWSVIRSIIFRNRLLGEGYHSQMHNKIQCTRHSKMSIVLVEIHELSGGVSWRVTNNTPERQKSHSSMIRVRDTLERGELVLSDLLCHSYRKKTGVRDQLSGKLLHILVKWFTIYREKERARYWWNVDPLAPTPYP